MAMMTDDNDNLVSIDEFTRIKSTLTALETEIRLARIDNHDRSELYKDLSSLFGKVEQMSEKARRKA